MTKEEILGKSNWNKVNSDVLQFTAFSQVFKKDVPFSIHFSNPGVSKILSQKTLDTINEFLALDSNEIETINKKIWNHCLRCHQTTKSSFDGGKTWQEYKLEDNLRDGQIESEHDALSKTYVSEVYIDNNNGFDDRILWLMIGTSWDVEHDINFTYINGKLDSVT
ncbi:MAG: hypothetical protein HEP71_27040 [Roseivirga sp.]|nr:hypothetical protein [Roseivirga sp.]